MYFAQTYEHALDVSDCIYMIEGIQEISNQVR